jgi:hypothetical protein
MSRMHLGAKVPNEGARRLAWWIGEKFAGDVAAFAAAARVGVATIERLIAGEIAPGTDIVLPIGVATLGTVHRDDWRRQPLGSWWERPAYRPLNRFLEQETRGRSPAVTRAGAAFPPLGAAPAPVRAVHA